MITPDKIVSSYIEDNAGLQERLDADLLYKWAADFLFKVADATLEQWVERVLILPVTNYVLELPSDFKKFIEVAFYETPVNPQTRWQVTQYVYDNLADNCKVEVNLKCPDCDQNCENCNYYYLEVDVDKIWEQAHPEAFNRSKFTTESNTVFGQSNYHPSFKIMTPSTNSFFNWYAPYCTDFQSIYKYKYNNRFNRLEFGFREGYVMLAYYGVPMDDYGVPTLTDIPEVYEAASSFLDEKIAWQEFKAKQTREAQVFYKEASARKSTQMRIVKSKLAKFDIKFFWAEMEKYYLRRLGRDPFKSLL